MSIYLFRQYTELAFRRNTGTKKVKSRKIRTNNTKRTTTTHWWNERQNGMCYETNSSSIYKVNKSTRTYSFNTSNTRITD